LWYAFFRTPFYGFDCFINILTYHKLESNTIKNNLKTTSSHPSNSYLWVRNLSLYFIIGPGPQELRVKLSDIAKNKLSLFNMANRKLTKQWFSIYKKSFLKAKDHEDKESEEIRDLLEKKFIKFKESDLSKIEDEIMKYKDNSLT